MSGKGLGSVSFRGWNFTRDSCFFYRLLRFDLIFCLYDAPEHTVIPASDVCLINIHFSRRREPVYQIRDKQHLSGCTQVVHQ